MEYTQIKRNRELQIIIINASAFEKKLNFFLFFFLYTNLFFGDIIVVYTPYNPTNLFLKILSLCLPFYIHFIVAYNLFFLQI